MNKGLAALRVSSFVASPATILPFDLTSFITDHQQTWLNHSPPSSASATQPLNSFNQDFALFDTRPETPQEPQQHLPAPATSSTVLSNHTLIIQQPRRYSALNNRLHPQVNTAHQSQGLSTLSIPNRSYSTPTSNIHQQHQRHLFTHSQKPPVPLFNGSETINKQRNQPALPHRRTHSTSSVSQGNSQLPSGSFSPQPSLIFGDSTDMDVFDELSLPLGEDPFGYLASTMDLSFNSSSASNFMPINTSALSQPSANRHTVSPQDLIKDTIIMSAPSSTAFPNLSTPGSNYLESPFLESSSLDTSPMVNDDLDSTINAKANSWEPLFPPDESELFGKHPVANLNTSFTSAASGFNESGASPMVRQKSSPGRPSTSSGLSHKHSDTAGVKPNRARKPLAAIVVADDDDRETAKRKKNTAAARKSRQRKQETHETLLGEIDRLKAVVRFLGGDPDDEYCL